MTTFLAVWALAGPVIGYFVGRRGLAKSVADVKNAEGAVAGAVEKTK